MEALFKQKLLDSRSISSPTTFSEALFSHRYFQIAATTTTNPMKSDLIPSGFTEKQHLIESLERFVEEKVGAAPVEEAVISVGEKAEIALKSPLDWEAGTQDYVLQNELKELILKDKKTVEVIFVTESLRAKKEFESELTGEFIDQLLCGFPLKTAQLFERMIFAMKLDPKEVILYPAESEGEDLFSDIVKLTYDFKPKVIMTLGAKAASAVLKNKDRLSVIHGQFFSRKISGFEVQVVPLFHPNIIETNQNMKKTAWTDMQKVMKFLKKLP